MVRGGETGLIFPRRDPAALAAAMERLMDRPGERAAMGAAALALYEREFTGAAFARRVEEVYRQVLKGV